MARSLNRVELIGNLTRDPELRYTPSGAAVCTIGIATNRSWNTEGGEKKEETEFHRIVAWNKLAEICSQFLVKGRKVYVQGRLATRNWTGQDGQARTTVEIVIDDMILLDSPRSGQQVSGHPSRPAEESDEAGKKYSRPSQPPSKPADTKATVEKHEEKLAESPHDGSRSKPEPEASGSEDVNPDDIPF